MKPRILRAMSVVVLLVGLLAETAWIASASTSFYSPLSAISGSGSGTLQGATTGAGMGTLSVQGEADVWGTAANTSFNIQRTTYVPYTNCDPSQVTQGNLVLGSFTTSASGAGSGHFQRNSPAPSGTTFDVLFQVVSSDGSILLQSNCLTVTAQ